MADDTRHPSTQNLLRWFRSDHLPVHLQKVVQPIEQLAQSIADGTPDSPELSAGLRKLLEAKDCFVRAAIDATEADADPVPG